MPSFREAQRRVVAPWGFAGASSLGLTVTPFPDLLVLQLTLDGEMDTTFRIELPPAAHTGMVTAPASSSLKVTCLVGRSDSLKLRVLANEVGKAVAPGGMDVLLTVSGKVFCGTEVADDDAERLAAVVALVKRSLSVD